MNKSATSLGKSRLWAGLWAVVAALIAVALTIMFVRGVRLETSVLAMLPADERDPTLAELAAQLQGRASRTLLMLVGHEQPEQAVVAATRVESELRESGEFTSVLGAIDREREQALFTLYFPCRYQILAPRLRTQLEAGAGPDELANRVLDMLQGPLSSVYSGLLEHDPLLLQAELMRSWADEGIGVASTGGFATVNDGAMTYALVVAVTQADPFDASGQRVALDRIEHIARELPATAGGAVLRYTGVPRFAIDARDRMKREMTIIGIASTIGTALCILLVFRSWRPLVLSFLPMVVSIAAGTLACVLVFPRVHVLTLVFGTSLTGLGVDYALHYFCVQRTAGSNWNAWSGMLTILPGITIGMLTSVVGFSGLYLTSFPVLRQFALFSSVGLAAAWATVVAWYPPLSQRPSSASTRSGLDSVCDALLASWLRWRRWRGLRLALFALCTASLVACLALRFEDDIRKLQQTPRDIASEDRFVRAVAGHTDDSRFVLVEGATEEEALVRLEQCSARLRSAIDAGSMVGIHSLASFVPSRARQERDHELLRNSLVPHFDQLAQRLDEIGFERGVVDELHRGLESGSTAFIDIASFFANPATEFLRPLWLGQTERGFSTTVLLRGVSDASAIEAAVHDLPGVHYIDRVRDLSNLMRRYRVDTLRLVGLAYLVVALVLCLRFGWRQGLVVLMPAAFSASGTLLVLSACGVDLTMFHLLGLVLVLGLAVDYGTFLAESGRESSTAMLALALSTITAMIAFGSMLASSAPPLRALGASVSLGLALAFVLAPSAWNEDRA